MTADQHNRLIADAKLMRGALPDAIRWAQWWARIAPVIDRRKQ